MKNYCLKGVLHNLSAAENTSRPDIVPYCHGIVLGCISVLLDDGMIFADARGLVKDNLPDDFVPERFPEL